MNPLAMFLALVALTGFFAWSAKRRWQLLRTGGPEPRFSMADEQDVWLRLKDTLVYAFGQKKMPNYPAAGVAHIFIFAGFIVLLLRSTILWGRGFDPDFDYFGILARGTLLGDGYNIVKDFFACLVVIGASVFFYLRVIRREKRMTLGMEGLLILGIITTMMLADFLYDGASIVSQFRALGILPHFIPTEPMGSLTAMALTEAHLDDSQLQFLLQLGFWWHSLFVLIFLNILPYSKHFHIITAIPNVFTRNHTPKGALPLISDIEDRIEKELPIGIQKASDLSWKAILDAYTCTECGRCSDNCPAYTTGKVLSPKHLMLATREHLFDSQHQLIQHLEPSADEKDKTRAKHVPGNPPAGAYLRNADNVPLIPEVITADVIWGCTTCRACEEQCPVMITFVDKIIGMRRAEILMRNEFPAELQKPFTAMEVNGNPWNLPAVDRTTWKDGLDIPSIQERPDAQVLYWVGCAASYDDRAKKIARATARLLLSAGVDFAILGQKERCTGDPARRAGNEYLYQLLAQGNIETLNAAGADKKTIVTACPHCFNTLMNEYPQLGGHYHVVHHTDFLMDLVHEKKIIPKKEVRGKISYHDSCYLGRYNDVYDSPRDLLRSIPGVELVEVPYWNRKKGLCCGAGGAQMWMEEQNETRVNKKRTLQLIDTGATTLASGCPFCMTMLSDGIKGHEKEESLKTYDVAELLEQSAL